MKTTNYKKGDVVILSDGYRYKYLGEMNLVEDDMSHTYRPIDGKTEYATTKNAAGNFAPFYTKITAEVVGLKWYEKVLQWWKDSNRWKHLLFAIPLGAVCGAPFTTGVGLGMEVKDHLYGGRADFVDFLLTAVGGAIGHGIMLAVGLDYGVMALINLL